MLSAPKPELFALSFFLGFCMISIELISGLMLNSLFGNSLMVWSVILLQTSLGLSMGYFAGGFRTDKKQPVSLVFWLLMCLGVIMLLTRLLMNRMAGIFLQWDFRVAATVAGFFMIMLPLFFIGMIFPLMVSLAVEKKEQTGSMSGWIFGLSNIGGITGALLTGFVIIPLWGLNNPVLLFSSLVFLAGLIYFLFHKNIFVVIILFIYILIAFIPLHSKQLADKKDYPIAILHDSYGLLGNLKVADYPYRSGDIAFYGRILLTNHIGQTVIERERKIPASAYVHVISTLASYYPAGSKVLLVGGGGGALAKECNDLGFQVDMIELDKRIPALLQQFFYPGLSYNLIIDDGRHYLRTAGKKYNLVIIDVFAGETLSSHLFSFENFESIKANLLPGGMVFINFHGFWEGEEGKSSRLLANTMVKSGMDLLIVPTAAREEVSRNLVFIASADSFSVFSQNHGRQNTCCSYLGYSGKYSDYQNLWKKADFSGGEPFLTDDVPVLEIYQTRVSETWRKRAIEMFEQRLLEEEIPVF